MVEKLPEKDLEIINRYLKEYYGQTEDRPHFRLVWSDDLLEKRLVTSTPEGILLARPMVREVKKYHYIDERYVLERLTVVPEFVETDLVEKLTYEPVWTFEKKDEQTKEVVYVRPNFAVCRFIIETLLEQIRTAGYTKYRDPESTPEEAKEAKEARINGLMHDLFGDETAITDALGYRQGVAYGQGSSPNSSTPIMRKE